MKNIVPRLTQIFGTCLSTLCFMSAALALVSSEPAAAQADPVLDEVIVTARKREESLQRTPISIKSLSDADLFATQLKSLDEVEKLTPNMVFNNGIAVSGHSDASAIGIRGVGQADFTLNVDPAVGIYLDGVYLSRSIGSNIDLLDIERVEVLRGPQGTLFGKNTTGGAVNVITRLPTNVFEGYAGLGVGKFDKREVYLVANIPINDSISTRSAVSFRERDGYVRRVSDGTEYGDINSLSGRFRLFWNAGDRSSVNITLMGSSEHEGTAPVIALDLHGDTPPTIGQLPSSGFIHNIVTPGCVPFPAPIDNPDCFNSQFVAGPFSTNSGLDSLSNSDTFGIAVGLDSDLSQSIEFKSTSSFRSLDAQFNLDVDFSPFRIFDVIGEQNFDVFTQEFELQGSTKRTSWIVGAFYLKEDGRHIESVFQSYLSFTSGGDTVTKSSAIFGQLSFELTESLIVTAGLRRTSDKKSFVPDSFVTDVPLGDLGGQLPPNVFVGAPIIPPTEAIQRSGEYTPLFNLSYQASDQLNLYLTFSEGFKSGGFSQRVIAPRPAPTFGPESIAMREFGFKYSNSGNSLRLNAALFLNKFKDMQVLGRIDGVAGNATVNAGNSDISGAELDFALALRSGLRLEIGVAYLDARYTSIRPDSGSDLNIDNKFPNVSEFSGTASLSYLRHVGGGHELLTRIDWSYRSDWYNDAQNRQEFYQPSVNLLSASIGLELDNGKWAVIVSGKNLANETYLISAEMTEAIASSYGIFGLPRTWAVNIERRF
jgi:iron complex outermembrane recepter protein